MRLTRLAAVLVLSGASAAGASSPVEFGRKSFLAALEARGLKPERFKVITEHSMVLPADGFSIQGYLIRGGNLRGIMFGLLEAAEQIRTLGRLKGVKGVPKVQVRGVRWTSPLPSDPAPLFQALARARFNRFVAAHPGISVEVLRQAAESAASHGLDFGAVLAPGGSAKDLLAEVPNLKFIEAEPSETNLREITGAGRLLTLDLDGTKLSEEALSKALATHLPLQVIVAPGEFGDFLRKPEVSERTRAWSAIWRLRTAPAASSGLVRASLPAVTVSQSQGFEIEASSNVVPFFFDLWGRLSYDPTMPDSQFPLRMSDALDAAASLPPMDAEKPLIALLDTPAKDRWAASPNEAARLRLKGEASAKSRPLERAAALDDAALRIERTGSHMNELKPLAASARLLARRLAAADHLAWARATGDASALGAARREAAAALSLAPGSTLLQGDIEALDAEKLDTEKLTAAAGGPQPSRHPGTVTRPAIEHFAPRRALAGQPLQVALRIWPVTSIKTVRMHWRPLNANAVWQTQEALPSRPAFTLPGPEVTLSHDIEYYFEVLHTLGSGWFLPENVTGTISRTFVVETAGPVDRPGGAW